MKHDIFALIKRVVVINLPQRTDRLTNFQKQLDEVNWQLREVEVVRAVRGDTVGVPEGWKSGGGAFGCRQSHLRVLEDALMDGLSSVMVFEDDAFFHSPETWNYRFERFISEVPNDWECLMIGGQHVNRDKTLGKQEQISENVVRCVGCERTHCYILRGTDVMKGLYRMWSSCNTHIDWNMGPFMGKRGKTYAPSPFLVGQEQGKSDISGRKNGRQLWSKGVGDYKAPVYVLRGNRDRMETLKEYGYHFGYTQNADGVDKGLAELFAQNISPTEKGHRLLVWVHMIDDEAYSVPDGKTAVWLPQYTDEQDRIIRKALGNRYKEIT